MCVQRVFLVGFLGLSVATAGFAGSRPIAVSPGDPAKLALIADPCPTFSWGQVDRANGYELVVYRLGEGEQAEPLLRESFEGSVFGWTPSLDRCLDRGGRYAWSVRAVGGREASDWSPPTLFQVAAGPSRAEFEAALAVVRQYLVTQGEPEVEGIAETHSEPASEPEAPGSSPVPRSVGTTQLSVDGGVVATSFTGDGSTLTSLDPTGLSAGTAAIDISGTAATASDLVGAACVSESELDFDPTTQAEMTTHAGEDAAHHTPPTALPPSGPAGGELAGSYPNPIVSDALARDTEVTTAISTHTGSTSAHHAPPTSLPPSGAAGGDLAGTYPNPVAVAGIARDSEVTTGIATHTSSADAHRDHATLEESAEIDADIGAHAALPNVHHTPTVDTDTVLTEAQVETFVTNDPLGMGNNPITDIGAPGTDFTATGGLTVSDDLRIDGDLGIGANPLAGPEKIIYLYDSRAYSDPRVYVSGHNSGRLYLQRRRPPDNHVYYFEAGCGSQNCGTDLVLGHIDPVGAVQGCILVRDGCDVDIPNLAVGTFKSNPTDSPGTCDGTTEGGLYYDDSLDELCYCNSSAWYQVDGGGAC